MHEHTVQFYNDDAFLVDGLCSHVGAALAQGGVCMVIASREHLAMLELRLCQEGWLNAAESPVYLALQADSLLPLFMKDGKADQGRFVQAMDELIARAGDAPLYVVSEMAALLQAGGGSGALAVEQGFARLLELRPFSLLCVFPLSAFPSHADGLLFRQLCALHHTVLPAESYDPQASRVKRLSAIAAMQQQAYALETEAACRRQAEHALLAASYDTLTGLPNRSVFQDRLAVEMKKAQRTGLPLALFFIDLDFFKQVNDTLGHDRGDALLVLVAQRLSDCVRKGDTVARLGGDEFTMVLPALADPADVARVAQAVLARVAEPFDLGSEVVYVSASIGIAFYPQDATGLEQLVKCADQAMYASKDQGGNLATYFTAAMQEAAQERLELAAQLSGALARRQLRLLYQPVVDLESGAVCQAEALLRWEHPWRGLLGPAEFIPTAEQCGLILPIGDWVLYQAARQAARWRRIDPHFQVRVNLSPAQFRQDESGRSHALEWTSLLARLPLWEGDSAASQVMLEVPEPLLSKACGTVQDGLLALRRAGIQLSLEDYGGGSAALPALRRYGVEYLKISQALVAAVEEDAEQLRLCRAIVALAHTLGLKVVAAGVQTSAQSGLLRQAGCDLAQGYLYGRPMPAARLQTLLVRQNALGRPGMAH